jgi:hypothetical protein
VLSTRLVGGKPQIRVYAQELPEPGFSRHEADLEDVYFLQLRKSAGKMHAAATAVAI